MSFDIPTAVAALPAAGGWVRFYSWDAAEHDANMRALRRAAYARRFVIVATDGHHGREAARLVPQSEAPVRCCAGMRHAGKARRRRSRRRSEQVLAALRFRDRLAAKIGWSAAIADPHFDEVLRAAMRRRRKP